MVLKASEVSHIYEAVVVDLNAKVAALLDVDCQLRVLSCQLAHKSTFVSQSFTDLHAYLSVRLPIGIELPVVEDELLVLEEHRHLQVVQRHFQFFHELLNDGVVVHEV